MTIFRVIYPSGELHVIGYLGIPGGVSEKFLVEIEQWSHDNAVICTQMEITGERVQLSHNDNTETRRWPGFLYCRGGIGRVGMVKLDWVQEFTQHGYVVFAPSYRGADGGEGRDEFGGMDVEDSDAGYRLLASMPWVNRDRISAMGFSRGSINATKTTIRCQGVHKLILWGGVSDLAATYEQRVDLRRMLKRVVGGTPTRLPEQYRDRSPVAFAHELSLPTLIVHGSDDVQVNVSHALLMYEVLREHGDDVTLHCYHGYGHHLPDIVHNAVVDRMFDWLMV